MKHTHSLHKEYINEFSMGFVLNYFHNYTKENKKLIS